MTFGMGAIADWLPTYISRNVSGAGNMDAGLITGAATVVGGLFGTLLGGKYPNVRESSVTHTDNRLLCRPTERTGEQPVYVHQLCWPRNRSLPVHHCHLCK